MTVLTDGSPEWLPQVERWLVGAAMLSSQEDVQVAAATCLPEDFRDEVLAKAWSVLPYLECPCAAHLVREIGEEHAPEMVELSFAQGAFLYASRVCLEAHAELVHEWGTKRRTLQLLSQQAQEIYAGRPSNVTPIYDRPEYRGLESAV